MSGAQWDSLHESTDVEISVASVNPIEGLGSFQFRKAPVGFNRHGAIRRNVEGERYLRSGALQAIFMPKLLTESGASHTRYGITFLWDADGDPTASSGAVNCYLAGFDTQGNAGAGAWGVWRYPNRFHSTAVTIAEGPSTPAVAHDTAFTLDVEWRQHPLDPGGVQIIVSVGAALDFSDLAPVVDITDSVGNGALMGESFGEGVAFAAEAGNGEMIFLVDNLSGDRVDPVTV